jgi:NitT/TauT family transport system permease protein
MSTLSRLARLRPRFVRLDCWFVAGFSRKTVGHFSATCLDLGTVDVPRNNSGIRAFGARLLPALSKIGWTAFSLGFFAGLWELAWAVGWANPRLMPPPHIFLGDILEQTKFFSPTLRWQVGVGVAEQPSPLMAVATTVGSTIGRVLAGITLATCLSIALGIAIRRYLFVERLTLPTVSFLAPISPIAWLPIAIFLFGIGNPPAIFMVFIAIFFTMTLATIAEIDAVDRNLINAARIMGATRSQIYRRVILPAIAPGLLVVLRMNMFSAWMVVLLAEATGVGSGLGQIIMLARNTFNPSLVFFTVTLIGILGFTSDWLLCWLQRRFLFWTPNAGGRSA